MTSEKSGFEKFVYPVLIRESHLDSFGHVNNATYLELFEEARWDFTTKNGYSYQTVHAKKQGPVILEVNLRFQKELQLRQEVRIETQMLEYDKIVGSFEQKIVSGKDTEHATAVFKFGLFDLKERKLMRPTPEWLKAVGKIG